MKKLLTTITILFLSGLLHAQQNAAISSAVGSSNTDANNAALLAIDGNTSTGWKLASGSTAGFLQVNLASAIRLDGLSWSGSLGANTNASVWYQQNGSWKPFLAGVLQSSGFVDLSLDQVVTSQIQIRLNGSDAASTVIAEVQIFGRGVNDTVVRVFPSSISASDNTVWSQDETNLSDADTTTTWKVGAAPWTNTADDNAIAAWWQNLKHLTRTHDPSGQGSTTLTYAETISLDFAKVFLPATLNTDLYLETQSGSSWTQIAHWGSGTAAGWQRVSANSGTQTQALRLRVSVPTNAAVDIGEFEVWAHGTTQSRNATSVLTAPVDLSSYPASASFNSDSLTGGELLFVVSGTSAVSLGANVNGTSLTADLVATQRGRAVYSLLLTGGQLVAGDNFVRVGQGSGILEDIQWAGASSAGANQGIVARGPGNFGDRVLYGAAGPDGENIIALAGATQLERIEVPSTGPLVVSAWAGVTTNGTTIWTPLNPVSQNSGLYSFDGAQIVADKVKVSVLGGGANLGASEISVWGSLTTTAGPALRIYQPYTTKNITGTSITDGQYLIGWTNDGASSETASTAAVAGIAAHARGNLFWIATSALGLTDGQENTVAVTVKDSQNRTVTQTFKLQYDTGKWITLDQSEAIAYTAAPVYTISGSTQNSSDNVFVNGTRVNVSGKHFTTTVSLVPGLNVIAIQLQKNNGTVKANLVRKVVRVSGGLFLAVDAPVDNALVNTPTVNVIGRTGGVGSVTVTVNSNGGSTLSVPVVNGSFTLANLALTEGTNTIAVTGTDSVGQTYTRVLNVTRDTVAPAITSVTPASASIVNTQLPTITVNVTDASASWIQIGMLDWIAVTGGAVQVTYPFADGTQNLTIKAIDAAGNLTTQTVTYTVDTQGPTGLVVTANVPSGKGAWTNNPTPTISFSATDAASGIAGYQVSIDGGEPVAATSPYALPTLADGSHVVAVIATDKAGWTTGANVQFQVDTTPPAVPTVFRPIPGDTEVDLAWAGSGEAAETYRVERNPAWSDGLHSVSTPGYADAGLTSGTTYDYRVWAVDQAGNESIKTAWANATVAFASVPATPAQATVVEYKNIAVVVPANVLANDVTSVVVDSVPVSQASVAPINTTVGPIYQLRVVRTDNGTTTATEHADFSDNIVVKLAYDPALIPTGFPEQNLNVYYFNTMFSRWVKVADSGIDTDTHQVYFLTNHFTDFSVQATTTTELSPQEMREISFSPLGTNKTHAPVTVGANRGNVSTAFTEAVLPGKNHLDLTIQRVYDTGTARMDAPNASYFGQGGYLYVNGAIELLSQPNGNTTTVRNEMGQDLSQNGSGYPAALSYAKAADTQGDYPWYTGMGWRLNFPSIRWSESGMWIKGADGETMSLGQFTAVDDSVPNNRLILESHEQDDLKLELVIEPESRERWVWALFVPYLMQWKEYHFQTAKLTYKDGRTVNYDNHGHVTSMTSADGLESINFTYNGNKAASITDTMGRVVTFDYSYNLNTRDAISGIHITANGEQRDISYHYTDGFQRLIRATDTGNRDWNYTYANQILASGGNGASGAVLTSIAALANANSSGNNYNPLVGASLENIPTFLKGNAQFELVFALQTVQGPGIGTSTVTYQPKALMFTSAQDGLPNTSMLEQLTAANLTVAGSGSSRATGYSFDFAYGGHNQFYTSGSTVDDGRTTVKTVYTPFDKNRKRISDSSDAAMYISQALGKALIVGEWIDNIELMNVPKFSTVTTHSGTVVSNNAQTWSGLTDINSPIRLTESFTWKQGTLKSDPSLITPVIVTDMKANSTNSYLCDWTYDGWGNVTSKVEIMKIAGRTNTKSESWSYYNTGSVDLTLGNSAVTLGEPVLSLGQKALVAAHRATVGGVSAYGVPDLNEYEYFTYTNLGQLASGNQWTGAAWATTTYNYIPNTNAYLPTGDLVSSVSPTGQLIGYNQDYNYPNGNASTTHTGQYNLGYAYIGVNLGLGAPSSQIPNEQKIYKTLTGTLSTSQDAMGNATTRFYDNLDRVIELDEPAETAGIAKTTIVYDDIPGELSSTVTNPLGLVTKYFFDDLGRLVKMTKDSSGEVITTTLEYDNYDQVIAVHGPMSDHESDASRTLASLATSFTYDEQGRLKTVQAPGVSAAKTSTYDDSLNRVTSTDEVGNLTVQTIDWNGKVIDQKIMTANPIHLQTWYDGSERKVVEVDGNGNVITHLYSPQGTETTTKLPARVVGAISVTPVIVKTYDLAGNLTQTTQDMDDGTQRVTNYIVNGVGEAIAVETPVTVDGASKTLQIQYTYDSKGSKTRETSGYKGETLTAKKWEFDAHARMTKSIDEEGKVTSYQYDLAGNRTQVKDPRQGLFGYTGRFQLDLHYNTFSRLVTADLPSQDGSVPHMSFAYDGRGNLVSRTEADGQRSDYSFTLRNQVKTETLTDGSTSYVTSHKYDNAGRETSVQGPSGRIVYTQYDEANRSVKTGNENLGWTVTTYDGNSNKLTVTDGNGHTTVLTYNEDNRPASVRDAKGKVSTTTYDRWSQIVQTQDAEKNIRTMKYDQVGRMVQEITPTNGEIDYSYDAWNDVTKMIDARNNLFVRTYTPTHRLKDETVNGNALRSYTYDEGGDVKTKTDGFSTISYNTSSGIYQPNPYGLVTSKKDQVFGIALTMTFAYDNRQRLTGVTNPDGSTISYTYNTLNQLTTMPGWITGSLNYDSTSGLLKGYTLGNGVTKSYTYDSEDRIQSMSYDQSVNVKNYVFTYDKAANIVSKNQNSYNYDEVNRLIGSNERGWFQHKPEDLTLAYAAQNSDYAGQAVMTFNVQPTDIIKFDMAARSIAVDLGSVLGVNKIELKPNNPINRVRAQDLQVLTSTDNQNFAVNSDWGLSKNATNGTLTLTFGKIFQTRFVKIVQMWDDLDVNGNVVDKATFVNTAKELVKVWTLTTSRSEAYTYDALGNRNSLAIDGNSANYKYYKNTSGGNLSWLACDGTWYYSYDASGNMIQKAKAVTTIDYTTRAFVVDTTQEYWTYSWDFYNRMIGVYKNGNVLAAVRYTYNADNLRIQRQGADGITKYAYGRNGALTYQKNLDTGDARTLAYLNSQIVGWTDVKNGASIRYYATTDQTGSVTAVTDTSAKILWSSEYTPFGKVAGVEGTYAFGGLYTGKDLDPDTGLEYHWNRWYDSSTGRFVSEDPARDGTTWYGYGYGNPLRFTDATGLAGSSFPTNEHEQQVWNNLGLNGSSSSSGDKRNNGYTFPSSKTLWDASHVVYDDPDFKNFEDYNRLSPEQAMALAGITLEDPESGFKMALFQNKKDPTKYIAAFAGTQDLVSGDISKFFLGKDGKTDVDQALGKETAQYDRAIRTAQKLVSVIGKENITFTGHSLGGGLAAAAAMATGAHAVIFNAAKLNPNTMRAALEARGITWGQAVQQSYGLIKVVERDGQALSKLEGRPNYGNLEVVDRQDDLRDLSLITSDVNDPHKMVVNILGVMSVIPNIMDSINRHTDWDGMRKALKD